MRNDLHARADVDYAAYLVRVRSDTLEEALDELDPSANHSDGGEPGSLTQPTESTDYFVFYQDNGRWAWRRVNQAETVVESSRGGFRFYLQCVADARQHGWNGKALSLFSASDFCRYG